MGAELQKQLMPVFHYALNPGGMLVLGSFESVGDFVNLFEPIERKSRIFQRKAQDFSPHRLSIPGLSESPAGSEIARRAGSSTLSDDKLALQEIAERALLEHYPRLGR